MRAEQPHRAEFLVQVVAEPVVRLFVCIQLPHYPAHSLLQLALPDQPLHLELPQQQLSVQQAVL